MVQALTKFKPRVSLAVIDIASVYKIREWYRDPYYAEYFRRYAPEFTWGDDTNVVRLHISAFFICVENVIVGLVNLANYDTQNKQLEVGLLLESTCPAKVKTMFEALDFIKEYTFNYLNFEKLYAKVLTHRKEIKRTLIMNGFTLEGTLRKNIYWNNAMHDEWLFTQLKQEWL